MTDPFLILLTGQNDGQSSASIICSRTRFIIKDGQSTPLKSQPKKITNSHHNGSSVSMDRLRQYGPSKFCPTPRPIHIY